MFVTFHTPCQRGTTRVFVRVLSTRGPRQLRKVLAQMLVRWLPAVEHSCIRNEVLDGDAVIMHLQVSRTL